MAEPKTELDRNELLVTRRKELGAYQLARDKEWIDGRMADSNMARLLAILKRESDMERDYQERTDHTAFVNKQAKTEIDLASEITQVRREEICANLRRHMLWDRDLGLRELVRKIKNGYTCKDLKAQIKYNEYRKLQQNADEFKSCLGLREALLSKTDDEDQEKLNQKLAYQKELQQQLVMRQRQRQCEYEEELIEKKIIDDVMRTISDEDMRELEQKRELMLKTRQEMKTFHEAKMAWKEKQKQVIKAEERAIEAQAKAVTDRTADQIRIRAQQIEDKATMAAKVCAKIEADVADRRAREGLLTELYEQEAFEKLVNDDLNEKNKIDETKKITRNSLIAQMRHREALAREQKDRDLAIRRETEEYTRKENEKELEKERRLKEKRREYAEDLKQQMRENEQLHKDKKGIETFREQGVWNYHRAWDAEVKEERSKILEEHAPHVLGYLQSGVLQPEDLPIVRKGANQHEDLAKLDIESMAVKKGPPRREKCNSQCVVLRQY